MIRGTTPTLTFNLPMPVEALKSAYITIKCGRTTIEKTLEDCRYEHTTLTVSLTQEETLKLKDCCKAKIQIRVAVVDGQAFASDIFEVEVKEILKDGVI